MFKIGQLLVIRFNNKNITGKLIGIDSYVMFDFEGKQHKWLSYTLVSTRKGAFSRYWITDRKSGWFLSIDAKKRKISKKYKLALHRSGIAQIDFKGDQGVSTPSAALLAHEVKKDEYYTIERFSKSAVMYFSTKKIAKPKVKK